MQKRTNIRKLPIVQIDASEWHIVPHDHKTKWGPKEEWIREHVGEEGIDWIWSAPLFADDHRTNLLPLRWGFKRAEDAALFAMLWYKP